MKRKYFYNILIITATTLWFFSNFFLVHAMNQCEPAFNGNWTVEWDCIFPSGDFKVFWNIIVWDKTIIVPTGVTLGINIPIQQVTFTTWKIIFQGTGNMQNIAVGNRYFKTVSYSAMSGESNCPSGWWILNTAGTTFQLSSVTNVPSSGTFRCGKL